MFTIYFENKNKDKGNSFISDNLYKKKQIKHGIIIFFYKYIDEYTEHLSCNKTGN